MSQAVAYNRQTSFTNFQAANPTSPPNGSDLDAEYNAIKTTTDQIRQNTALIQRDDGKLANASVTRDQLAPDVPIGFNKPVPWAPSTAYTTADTVFYQSQFFGCTVSHTSGASFDSTKFKLIADFSNIAISAASNVAVNPVGSITATNVQAALLQLDTNKSAVGHQHVATDLSDSSVASRSVMTAASVPAILAALGLTEAYHKPGDLKHTTAVVAQAGYLWADGASVLIASFPALYAATTINTTGNTANASAIITNIPTTANMQAGMPVNGVNISGFAATISSVDSATQITISAPCNGTTTGGALVVAPHGMADATHFNVADYRGRAAFGRDNGNNGAAAGRITAASGVFGITLGSKGGAEVVTLITSHLPVITPSGAVAVTIVDPQHSHNDGSGALGGPSGGGSLISSGSSNATTTNGTGITATATFTGNNIGSGTAHQNLPPCMICNVLVKT